MSTREQGSPDDPQAKATLTAIVPMSLSCPDVVYRPEDQKHPLAETSMSFQDLGSSVWVAELHGMLNGQTAGRVAEILGIAAGAGEQLGLAYACTLDAKRWLSRPTDDEPKNLLSARVFAEMTNYYVLGAGHALFNSTSRLLAMDPTCAAKLKLTPFDPNPNPLKDWPSFNSKTVKTLETLLDNRQLPLTKSLVRLLRDLVDDARWMALVDRRNTGYHRWRPQSVEGGTATTSPWREVAAGQVVMQISSSSGHVPLDSQLLVDEARAGLDALGAAMAQWLELMPATFAELGVPAFAVDVDDSSAATTDGTTNDHA